MNSMMNIGMLVMLQMTYCCAMELPTASTPRKQQQQLPVFLLNSQTGEAYSQVVDGFKESAQSWCNRPANVGASYRSVLIEEYCNTLNKVGPYFYETDASFVPDLEKTIKRYVTATLYPFGTSVCDLQARSGRKGQVLTVLGNMAMSCDDDKVLPNIAAMCDASHINTINQLQRAVHHMSTTGMVQLFFPQEIMQTHQKARRWLLHWASVLKMVAHSEKGIEKKDAKRIKKECAINEDTIVNVLNTMLRAQAYYKAWKNNNTQCVSEEMNVDTDFNTLYQTMNDWATKKCLVHTYTDGDIEIQAYVSRT